MEPVRTRWNGWGVPGHDDPLATHEPAWRWLAQAFAMPALLATPPRDLLESALAPSRLSETGKRKLIALLGAASVQQGDHARARHAAGRGLLDLLRLRAGDLSGAPDAVLYPHSEVEVTALLDLCAQESIALVPFGGGTGDISCNPGIHHAVAALNLSRLCRVQAVDTVSGRAEIEAGALGPDLERELERHGMMLGHRPDDFEFSSLGGWIAQPSAGQEAARYGGVADWLAGVRVATPQGILAPSGLPDPCRIMPGSRGALGVITSATVRIRALPEKEEQRAYLFPDFASGLAVMREAQRVALPHAFLKLSDDGQTRLHHAFERAGLEPDLAQRLFDIYLSVRRFDGTAARLVAGFTGSAKEVTASRKRFDALAKRLGAIALGVDERWRGQRHAYGYRRDTLLDRGAAADRLELWATWAKLPSLYVSVRAALKQAMRNFAPRTSAHGLVLCEVGPARADGATLAFTWIYPRILDSGVWQAENIRGAATNAARGISDQGFPARPALAREALAGIKRALDPTVILNPAVNVL